MPVGLFHTFFWHQEDVITGDQTPLRRQNPLTIYPWATISQVLFPRRPGEPLEIDPEHERRRVIEQHIEQALELHEHELAERASRSEMVQMNLQYGRLVRELSLIRSRDTALDEERLDRVVRRVQRETAERERKRQDRRKRDNRVKMAKVRAHKEFK